MVENKYTHDGRKRRVINEMQRQEIMNFVSRQDKTLVDIIDLWPVFVIILKSKLNRFFEIITKADLTSV